MNKSFRFKQPDLKEIKKTVVKFLLDIQMFNSLQDIENSVDKWVKGLESGNEINDYDFYYIIYELVGDVNITGEFNRQELLEYVTGECLSRRRDKYDKSN